EPEGVPGGLRAGSHRRPDTTDEESALGRARHMRAEGVLEPAEEARTTVGPDEHTGRREARTTVGADEHAGRRRSPDGGALTGSCGQAYRPDISSIRRRNAVQTRMDEGPSTILPARIGVYRRPSRRRHERSREVG